MYVTSTDNTVHKNINVNVRGAVLNKVSPESPQDTREYAS
jgi:hypothetical protein